jgi:hypothetical protein
MQIDADLIVVFFHEDDIYYALAPALDLYGYGKSDQEAKDSFGVVLREYLDFGVRNQTLVKDLEEHGWYVSRKGALHLQPPAFDDLIAKNHELGERMKRSIVATSLAQMHVSDAMLLRAYV